MRKQILKIISEKNPKALTEKFILNNHKDVHTYITNLNMGLKFIQNMKSYAYYDEYYKLCRLDNYSIKLFLKYIIKHRIKVDKKSYFKYNNTNSYMINNNIDNLAELYNILFEPKCETCNSDLPIKNLSDVLTKKYCSIKCQDNKNDYKRKLFFESNNIDVVSVNKQLIKIRCKCGKLYERAYSDLKNTKQMCLSCSIKLNLPETEISELFNINVTNDRTLIKPLEIDILSNEHKFGIEYNGLYWHSKSLSNSYKSKHLLKTKLVEEKGYQLFHIFENEWLDEVKKKIWISIINSKMNKSKRIYARKTIVKEVDSKTAKQFLENNHLQGNTNSSIKVGLYYENELVSIMTFGKSRFNKDYEYELVRMCNKVDVTVIGGFSKMLKYFERTYNPKSLLSYANRRWSQGNVYEKNGFTFSHNSSSNFYYFKSKEMILYSRNKFQKHKLKDIEGFKYNEDLSGESNMLMNNYRIIYDSGNKVYFKKFN